MDDATVAGNLVLVDHIEGNGLVWTGLDNKPDSTIVGSKTITLNKGDDHQRVVVDLFVDYCDSKVYGRAYHVKTGAIRWYLITSSVNNANTTSSPARA